MAKPGLQVAVDNSEIKRISRQLSQFGTIGALALSRAINDAVRKSKTISSQEIRQIYNIKARDISPTLKTKLSSPKSLQGELDASAPMIPLIQFLRSAPKSQAGPLQGISVQVLKTGGRSELQFGRAFIATMKNGHTGIFERIPGKSSAGHDKIRQLFSIGPSIMLGGVRAGPEITQESAQYMRDRLVHHLEFLGKQAAAKK